MAFTNLALAQTGEDYVKVDLVASVTAVEPGKPFDVAVRYKLVPEWHLYWLNPGDSGLPPKIDWKLPQGFTASEPRFPVPTSIDVGGGILNFGYSDELVLLVTITPPAQLPSGTSVHLSAETSYLVCKEVCLPGKGSVALTLSVGASQPALSDDFARWSEKLPQAAKMRHLIGVQQNDSAVESVRVTVDFHPPAGATKFEFFPGPSDTLLAGHAKIDPAGELEYTLTPLQKTGKVNETLTGVLAYTDSQGARRGLEIRIPLNVETGK